MTLQSAPSPDADPRASLPIGGVDRLEYRLVAPSSCHNGAARVAPETESSFKLLCGIMHQHIFDRIGTCILCGLIVTSSPSNGSHGGLEPARPFGFPVAGWRGSEEPRHHHSREMSLRTTSPARPEYMISAGMVPTWPDPDLKVKLPRHNS